MPSRQRNGPPGRYLERLKRFKIDGKADEAGQTTASCNQRNRSPVCFQLVLRQLFWENLHLTRVPFSSFGEIHANRTTTPATCLPVYWPDRVPVPPRPGG